MATDLERLQLRIEANTKGVENALRVLNKNLATRFNDMEKRTSEFESHLSNMGRTAMGVFATLGVSFGAAELARGLATTALEMDRVNKALVVATGSSAAAKVEFEFVRQTANTLGLELMSTAQQYSALAAAARGTALEGAATRDIFTGVATASSALGLSAADTAGVLNAVQQMISKGTVSAEELRGQMGERLPGAFQAAARAMGMTTEELGKQLELGNITADQLLPKLAKELMNLGEVAGTGLMAELNRVNNAWTELNIAFADTGAIDVAIRALQELTFQVRQFQNGGWGDFLGKIGNLDFIGAAGTMIGSRVNEGSYNPRGAGRTVGLMEDGFKPKPSASGAPRRGGSSSGRSRSAGALSEAQRQAELIDDALSSAEERARALADDRTEQKLANAFIVNEQVWDQQEAAALRVRDAYEQLGDMAENALDDIIIKGENAGEVIGRLLLQIAELILKQSVSGEGAFANVLGDIFGFGRASGGPVRRGAPYMVGEHGPEMFIPTAPGRIVPKGGMGGGGTVINLNSVVHAPGANPSTLALMNQMLSARDAQLRREIPSLMTDQKRRGALSGAFA